VLLFHNHKESTVQGGRESGQFHQGTGTRENEDTVKKEASKTIPMLVCFLLFSVSFTQGLLPQESTKCCVNVWAEVLLASTAGPREMVGQEAEQSC